MSQAEWRVALEHRRLAAQFLPEKRHRMGGAQQPLRIPTGQQLAVGGTDGDDAGRLRIHGQAFAYHKPVDRGFGLFLVLEPGCFAEQVPYASKIKVLWQHDGTRPLGLLDEAVDGPDVMRYRGWVTRDARVAEAENAAALLDLGIIDEVSIGFRILKYSREEDVEADTVTYRILKGHWEELSLVTWGAMERDATAEVEQSRQPDPALALRAARERAVLALAGAR